MTFNIETATGPELIAEYNRLADLLDLNPVKRFATRADGMRRVAALTDLAGDAEVTEEQVEELAESDELKRKYPEDFSPWHATHHKKAGRGKRDVMLMVYAELVRNSEGTEHHENGAVWKEVYLDNCYIDGMTAHIWAGHCSQLTKEGFYKRIKSHRNAFGMVRVDVSPE